MAEIRDKVREDIWTLIAEYSCNEDGYSLAEVVKQTIAIVRKATCKEIGEWLRDVKQIGYEKDAYCLIYPYEIEAFLQGKMPEEVR